MTRWTWSSAGRLDAPGRGDGLPLRRRNLAPQQVASWRLSEPRTQKVRKTMSATSAAQETFDGQWRAPRLLSGLRPEDVVDDPYAHFASSNMLPADVYAALEAAFPSLEMIL